MYSSRQSVFILIFLLMATPMYAQFKLYEKGHDYYQAGNYSEAAKYFADFLSKATHDKLMDPEVRYLLALSHYKLKSYQSAVENFEEALLLNYPNKGNMYWFMAKCHDNLGAHDEAVDNFTSAIRELGVNKEVKAKLLYERSVSHSKAGQLTLAYDDLKNGYELAPTNLQIKQELERIDKQAITNRSTPEITSTQQPVVKKNEAKKEETKKNNAVQDPAQKKTEAAKEGDTSKKQELKQNDPPASGETPADDIVANRLKSKSPNNQPKPEEKTEAKNTKADKKQEAKEKRLEAKPEVKETKQEIKPEIRETKSDPIVIKDSKANKSEIASIVNPIAAAYGDEHRYALVIGNSKYPQKIGVLRNPVNDATDIAKELEKSNFEVQLLTDATYGQMRAAMLKFKEKVDAGEKDKTVALFYYAGHGLAHEDENYLVPIDAMIEYEDDIARYCFGVQRMVLANMERSNSRMNIVILDACRNNPFPSLTRALGQQGLGEMKRARGSFIAFATAPGSVASDGGGRNGLYTQELLKAMRKPGLTIEQVFKDVRANVGKLSDEKQNTWDSSNIIGEFYFKF